MLKKPKNQKTLALAPGVASQSSYFIKRGMGVVEVIEACVLYHACFIRYFVVETRSMSRPLKYKNTPRDAPHGGPLALRTRARGR